MATFGFPKTWLAYNDLAVNGKLGQQGVDYLTTSQGRLPYSYVYAYNGTGAAVTSGHVYLLTFDGDEETNPAISTVVAASGASICNQFVVAAEDIAIAGIGKVAFFGYAKANCESTTDIAKDDYLRGPLSGVGAGLDYLMKDGTGKSTVSVARSCETRTDNSEGPVLVFLLGRDASI